MCDPLRLGFEENGNLTRLPVAAARTAPRAADRHRTFPCHRFGHHKTGSRMNSQCEAQPYA
jgi:hypothetical protein